MPRLAAIDWARPGITGIGLAGVLIGSTHTVASAGTAIAGTTEISPSHEAISADMIEIIGQG